MIVHPDTLADRGCWISDDRVYAFISSAAHGISEIGYHGAQPASRNARVFVLPSGAFQFRLTAGDGITHRIRLNEYDWSPGSMTIQGMTPVGGIQIQIRALAKSITVLASETGGNAVSFVVEMSKGSLFTDVHGRRTWQAVPPGSGWARFLLRDQIFLDEWMRREGPYGSDFLIPEPLRRKIYQRRVRSGLATSEDLLPEYKDKSLCVYDAEVEVELGGDEYCLAETENALLLSAPISAEKHSAPPFSVRFDARTNSPVKAHHGGTATSNGVRQRPPDSAPVISLPGFPNVERFFRTVPGLVDSCVLPDHGIPRATPGGYYWIWAWDAMVTALASLRWGAIELADRTAAFVDGNRDEGCIPMRWTHALEPMDTQSPGALESLLAALMYGVSRERQSTSIAGENYNRMVSHFEEITKQSDRRGLFPNIGFYPDLPIRFGRTEESAVAMEVGAFYSFCRILENCSVQQGDQEATTSARKMIASLERSFCDVFWDKKHKFFVDAVERKSGLRNESFPLFSLLFLHFPPAIRLIQSYHKQSADFISRHLLTSRGMRLLPAWDRNAGSETVSGSWYPHWDAYALNLLRRSGCEAEIMTWLGSVERTLEHLGYAPEYLVLDRSLMSDPTAWLRHGSASNLNCVTGWYEALLEGIVGLEFDPGGLSVVPLALPLEETAVQGVCHLGTRWTVKAKCKGDFLEMIRVDGDLQEACWKILRRYHDGGEHEIHLLYGTRTPGPHFAEISNAEVIDATSTDSGVEVVINGLGQVDLSFSAPDDWSLTVDGKHVGAVKQEWMGPRLASLAITGKHVLQLSRHR